MADYQQITGFCSTGGICTPPYRLTNTAILSPFTFLFLLIFAFCLVPSALFSQNLRTKILPTRPDSLRIDTLSIIPGSWKLVDKNLKVIPDSLYRIDWINAVLILNEGFDQAADSVRIEYEAFPIRFNQVYQHKDSTFNRIDKPVYRPPFLQSREDPLTALREGALQSSGSLSRGLSVGNQRDASLTSNLNLQLQGKLNRDFRIEATLTDANLPIQPEGNTRQIQDFDRVYMRIYNPSHEILGGDFDLTSGQGSFLRMNKKVQGAKYSFNTNPAGGKYRFQTTASLAVVKGKYSRNMIQGREGSQGPYLLTGTNGESYIQIIAGSERVHIDGIQLARGEDADYVIDYNTAEIRFTPRNLITKDKRIQVEFEYTERSYARFLFYNRNEWSGRRGSWFLNLYSENDARNQPLLQDLTEANRKLLSEIGDRTDLAQVSAVHLSAFRNDRVYYKIIDTLVNGIRYDSILVHSINPDSARYEAGFTFVGANRGHYEPVASPANGRVFRWVAPEDGLPAGSYEPVTRLITPQSKQVMTAGTSRAIGKRMQLNMELAVTRNDLNTFSGTDDADNAGMAIKTGITRKDLLKRDSSLMLSSFVNYRFAGSRFNPVERFREVEFERDWNLGSITGMNDENYLEAGLRLDGRDSIRGGYRMEYLSFGKDYTGFRQYTDGRLGGNKWEAGWNGSYLFSADPFRSTRFFRHSARYRQMIGPVSLEISENAEDNRWRDHADDSLLNISAAFREFRLQAARGTGEKQPWMIRIQQRTDLSPVNNQLKPSARAWEAESWVNVSKKPSMPFRAGLHFRMLDADSAQTSISENDRSVTGRIENRWQAWKGLLQSQTFYEIGSGFDRKPEYTYLEVPAGQGYYTWNDYNGNRIKELDEFEPAYFRDQASFIRIYRLGNEFVPTLVNRFNQVFTLQPKKGFISKFTSQLAYRIDKKTLRVDFLDFLNPFSGNISDPRIISLSSQLRHTLSFNRANPKFNADFITQRQASRATLVNGADGKTAWSNSLLIRYKFHESWQMNSQTELSKKTSVSDFFAARNYSLSNLSELIQMEYQPASYMRIGLDWEIRREFNPAGAEALLSNRVEAAVTGQIPEKGQISLSVQHIYISFEGIAESPAGYALLRGLKQGNNGIAQLSVRYKLGKNLVLEAVYEGRIATGSRVVHNAQVQVRAIF